MIGVVAWKELRDHLRDPRSVLGAMILPIIGPIVVLLLFLFLIDLQKDEPLKLPVLGADQAPHLITFLQGHGVQILPAPEAPEQLVTSGEVDAVLVFEGTFARRLAEGRSAPLKLLVDDSNTRARNAVRRLERLISAYSQTLAAQRIIARGIAPELAQPLSVTEENLAPPQKVTANLLNIIPLFLMLAALVGGMNVAIDTTAGERERSSLEPLLLNPVSRLTLVLGKWLATTAAAVVVTLTSLVGFWGAVGYVPLEDIGLRVVFGTSEALTMLAAVLPLSLVGSALQMLIATFARSFKEAQTYLNLLNLLPMLPSLFLMLNPVKSDWWMALVPTVAQVTTVVDVLRGEPPTIAQLGLIWGSSIVLTGACLGLLVTLLRNERIVFGR